MRENKYLYTSYGRLFRSLCWFLIATGLSSYALSADPVITEDQDDAYYYDSSLQRSNFFSIKPKYISKLEEEISDRRAQFFWRMRFDAQSLQTEGNINSQIAGANFVAKFNYKFLEKLQFKSQVSLNLESGRSQDIFGDQEPSTGAYPREALIQYTPFEDVLWVKAGLIRQQFFNNPLFIANLPFLGLSERLSYKGKKVSVALRLQQLVPTSYTTSTRIGDREETPLFYTESLEAKWRLSRSNFINGRVTHFRYQDLPAVVAFDSCLYGNSVSCTDINNARFDHEFEGFMGQLTFEQKISQNLSAQIQWHVIKNTQAPDELGESEKINIFAGYDFGRWLFSGQFTKYFIEADAVPASYNSHLYGNTNRIGQGYGLRLESKDWGVVFKGDYINAELLNPASITVNGLQQDNQQTIYFAVETMYDFI